MNPSDINLLKIYFGHPYPITDKITIYQPTIHDIIEYGEHEFYAMLFMFIGNTTYRKLFLWENGVDWNKVSDYEMFCNLVPVLPLEKTRVLFGDVDFETFELCETGYEPPEEEPQENSDHKPTRREKQMKMFELYEKSFTLYSEELDIEINAETYHKLVDVLRQMVQIFPKTEYTFSKVTKELMIEEEKNLLKREMSQSKNEAKSTLLPLISACINHPGFKYKSSELELVGISEFMDSVKRLQIYESTRALMNGAYSGMADLSKVPKEQFDFMRFI